VKQKTIKEKVTLSGVGLHSGAQCKLIFHPAKENHGLAFSVSGNLVPARTEYVHSTVRGTVLKKDGQLILLTEHLLAAGYALGISNLLIEMTTSEPPATDGSALPFILALQSGKIVEQRAIAEEIILKKQIEVSAEARQIVALPHHGLKIAFGIDFKFVGAQQYELEITEESFIAEIAPARTFGYVEELDTLKKQDLARGASEENALAIGPGGYINSPRFADEMVRHKILDLVGDLALLGRRINAEFRCEMSGHALNFEIGKKLLTNKAPG